MLPLKILALTVAAAAALALCVRAIEARFAFFPAAGEQETPRDAGVAFEPAANRFAVFRGDRLHAVAALAGDPRRRVTLSIVPEGRAALAAADSAVAVVS